MVELILFIFSSKLYIFFIFLLFYCATPWYRKLPNEVHSPNIAIHGYWVKKMHETMPYNSVTHKGKRWESIKFDSKQGTFIKKTEYKEYHNGQTTKTISVSSGSFQVKGNWILLTTQKIHIISPHEMHLKGSQKILYHFQDNTIIPLIDDTGYKPRDYGLFQYVGKPYEEGSLFIEARKIFMNKTFNSSVYHKSLSQTE